MLELCARLRLRNEERRVERAMSGKNRLLGDGPPERAIENLVDPPHASAAELANEVVAGLRRLIRHRRRGRVAVDTFAKTGVTFSAKKSVCNVFG